MPKKKVTKVKKAKAGKGKKDSKQESKADRESDMEKARANAALWQLRLEATEQSLAQYREACHKLARANEELINKLYRAEKDAIDMTDFMSRQEATKEEEINTLQKSLKTQEMLAREEKNKQAEDYTLQINEMKELFRKRSSDFDRIQDGFREIKEFQKMKYQLEQELSDMRESKAAAEKAFNENLNQMECKFLQEKAQLESEAEERIAVFVKKAHSEAITQLDDSLRSVFRENVRLKEALKYHIKETEELEKVRNLLTKENTSLTLDKNTFELTVKKNAAQMKAQKDELSHLRTKVASLEKTLEVTAEESKREMEREKEKTLVMTQASQVELEKLQKVLAMRERELGRIKRLASIIVEQRTELEQFFHQALAQVTEEITASRLQYKKEAQQAYRWRMREATAGRLKFPPIRTFHKSLNSTNSVYADMEAAAQWTHQPDSNVEMSDLTWEQKEQVIRLLFAKMNGRATSKVSPHMALSASTEKNNIIDSDAAGVREELPAIFNTEVPEPALPPNPNSLPDIHTT